MEHYFEKVELSDVLTILESEEGCYYNFLKRCEDDIISLRMTGVKCPYCDHLQILKNRREVQKEQVAIISEWNYPQANACDYEQKEELALFSVNLKNFTCPNCGCKSDSIEKNTDVSVKSLRNKVLISLEVKGMSNILALPYLPEENLNIEFPYFEQVEFNFRKGRICIRGITSDGRILHSVDVTDYPLILGSTELANWFTKSLILRDAVLEAFNRATKESVPYTPQEILMEDMLYLTRFIGYDRSFYSAIPYDKETLIVDKSFMNLKQLHTKKKAMEYLNQFSFGKYKSLKRQVCEMSGLLFYLPECDALFQTMGDVNVFGKLLESCYAFDLLLYIHNRPATLEFFRDFCDKKGAVTLYNRLSKYHFDYENLKHYMLYYCSLSKYAKKIEQEKWHGKQDWFSGEWQNKYSLPVTHKGIKDITGVFNGFLFMVMRNTSEYYRAGEELNNCLKTWDAGDGLVVSVSYAGKIVAAIEVDGKRIKQAYAYGNQSIDNVAGLSEAMRIWAGLNGLENSQESYEW